MMSTTASTRILFKKMHPKAKLPTQGKPGDAAFDLSCVEDVEIAPGETVAVSTGLVLAHMNPYENLEGDDSRFLQIVGRSGLALKGIFPLGGIIDSTYRGEIKVILHNGNAATQAGFCFKAGDRIAQMLIQRIITNDNRHVVEMVEAQEVTATERGDSGFGSTGQ